MGAAAWERFHRVPRDIESSRVEELVPAISLFKEAEDSDFTGKIIFDPNSSNSSAIEVGSNIQSSLVSLQAPYSDKDLAVWGRIKGAPITMENTDGEKSPEPTAHSRDKSQFTWSLIGVVKPATPRTIILRGNDENKETSSIDCILFTDQQIQDKNKFLTSIGPLRIDPEFAASDFRDASQAWGYSLPLSSLPTAGPEAPAYRISLHDWDEDKLRQSINPLLEKENTQRIILNFPNWPKSMDANADGLLDQESKASYTELIGKLAKIALDYPTAVDRIYFEIFEQPDGPYYTDLIAKKETHRVAELARIYLEIAREIRRINPDAKIGGINPTISENIGFHDQFIAITAPALDFYSIQSDIQHDAEFTQVVKEYLHKNASGRQIPLFITEPAPSSNAPPSDILADAWFLLKAFSNGADSAIVSSPTSATSSPTENQNFSRLYRALNSKFSGSCADFQTMESTNLATLTSQDRNSILLVYKGTRNRELSIPPGTWNRFLLDSTSSALQITKVHSQCQLPPKSIIYLERQLPYKTPSDN